MLETRSIPLRPHLPGAAYQILVRGQRFQSHGAAGVELLRAYSQLRAKAEFAAVGKAGGRVDVYAGGVNARAELCRGA